MYITLGQGLTIPWGRNFDVNRNILSFRSFAASFKKHFPHDCIHVYSSGAGADSPQRTKFYCQQKCLVTSFICCKLKKKCFFLKSDCIHFFFFHDLIHIHVYSPVASYLPYMGTAAILVLWKILSKLSLPHPIEAPYEIWLWLAQWFLRVFKDV